MSAVALHEGRHPIVDLSGGSSFGFVALRDVRQQPTLTRYAALREIYRLPPPRGLTRRQFELLRAFTTGGTYRAVAARMGISEQTVKNHASAIRSKLGVSSMIEAVWIMRRELE